MSQIAFFFFLLAISQWASMHNTYFIHKIILVCDNDRANPQNMPHKFILHVQLP